METLFIIALIVFIIGIFAILYLVFYTKFQEYIIRINEAEVEIDSILRKRFDLLNKSNEVIKNFINCEEEIDLVKDIKNQKLNNFDFDKKIIRSFTEFKSYRNQNNELISDESFIKIDIALNETEAELIASRKYYNDVIEKYNKLVNSFPANIIAFGCKYQSKNYFE